MKVVKWILGIVLSLLVIVVIFVFGYLRATLPDYDGEVVVDGIHPRQLRYAPYLCRFGQ
jgi:hypothetical protein